MASSSRRRWIEGDELATVRAARKELYDIPRRVYNTKGFALRNNPKKRTRMSRDHPPIH